MKTKYSLVRVRASRRLFIPSILASAFVCSLLSQRTNAADVFWDRGSATNAWGTAGNWSATDATAATSGALPAAADVAVFNITALTTAQTVDMGADRSLTGLRFTTSGTVAIQGGGTNRTLTLAASGITKSGAGAITIGSGTANQNVNIRLSADQTWANNNNSGAITVNNTVTASSAVARKLTIGGSSTAANIINAVISNNGVGVFSIDKSGAGLWILAGANTFTGTVNHNQGTLRIQNSAGLGANSGDINVAAAASATATTLDLRNTITVAAGKTLTLNSNTTGDLRSTLFNGANDNTWNSDIVAAGTGLVQVNAATGTTLTIGGTVTSTGGAASATLFSRGGGTVIYNGTINMGTDRVFNKTDGGIVIVNSTGNSWLRTQAADSQIQIGATNALANVELSLGQASSTNGRFEMNGFSQTVTRLNSWGGSTSHTGTASSGTNHIIRNSNLTTPSTLTFATPTATTDILKNVQIQGTHSGLGELNIVSNSLGRTEFESGLFAADSLTLNSGTIAFTGNASRNVGANITGASSATVEKLGTGDLVVQGDWDNAGTTNVSAGNLVLSNGTAGAINVATGATLTAGLAGGTIEANTIDFATGSTNYKPILGAPSSTAPISADTINAASTVTISPLGSAGIGTYALLDYDSLGGAGFSAFTLGAVGTYPHMTASLVDNTTDGRIDLNVTAVETLIWSGATNGTWDTNTTSNFFLSDGVTAATFYTGDAVLFNDAGANRTITGLAQTTGSLTFTNTTGNDYSIANPLTVAGNITKSGAGVVTLSGANQINGSVSVTEGVLKVGNANALAGSTSVTVSGTGAFDAGGSAPGVKYNSLTVSGSGLGSNGAVLNSGAGITNSNHFQAITLAGNTTWGNAARYDVFEPTTFNGGSYTLTKTGVGDFWFSPAAGSTVGNVIVNQGVFGLQTRSNILETTSTVTVNNTGIHRLWGVNSQHPVIVNEGGGFESGTGTSVSNGVITLNGTGLNKNLGGAGAFNTAGKITGAGGFTKIGTGAMNVISGENDFTGDVTVSAGNLNMSPTGNIPTTVNLTINGGVFDIWDRNHTVASLSGTGGTINTGGTALWKLTTTQSTNTVCNATVTKVIIEMSGSGSLTLGGTADNASGSAIVNSGTLVLAKGNTAAVGQAVHAVATGNLNINGGTAQLAGTYDNVTTLGTGVNLAPVGINASTYGDLIYNAVAINLNAGTLDMNGREEAINQLLNPTGAGGTITNTSATAAKLYVGHQNGASTFAGAINDGTGTVALEKIGTGLLTLSGTSNFTGGLTQTAGNSVITSTAALGNTPITVNANTFTLDGAHTTGAIAVNGTSIFAGVGTSGGTLTAASGSTVRVGTANGGTAAETLTLGGLSLSGGANINLDFNAAGTTVDKIATTVSGGVTLNGANNVNVVLGPEGWVTGTYPIITYAGTVAGTGATALTLATPVGHSTVAITDDTAGNINLVVTAAGDNKWVGNVDNKWDVNATANWSLSGNVFLDGDNAYFDDTATSFAPSLATNVKPSSIIFDNTANDYTLTSSGAFGITGTSGVIKMGTGKVTISTANTYTGTTDVQAGTLQVTKNADTGVSALSTGPISIAASSSLVVDILKTTNATDAIPNNLSGTGLLKLQFAAGTTARGISLANWASFGGTIQLSSSGATADKLGIASTGTSSGSVVVDSGATLYTSVSPVSFTGGITLSGAGNSEGRGALRVGSTALGGNISLAGSSTISMENITTCSISGDISTSVAGAHTLTLGGTAGSAGGILSGAFSDGTGTLAVNLGGGGTYTLAGELSHSGGVTVNNGLLVISGASNTYTGVTAIAAVAGRSLLVTANNALGAVGSGNETTVGALGQLGLSGGVNYTAAETVIGSGGGNSGAQGVFAAGSRGFIQSVSGNNTFAGNIQLAADGISRIGTQDGASLTLSGAITQASGVTTASILFRVGSTNGDFVTLSNSGNSFGVDSTIFTGLNISGQYAGVRIGVNDALPTNLTVSGFSGAGAGTALDLNGKNQSLNGLTNGAQLKIINLDTVNASTLTLNPTADKTTTNTTIQGGAGLGVINLIKDGTFTQTLSGANSYTGTTTVSAGTLALVGGSQASPITVSAGASLGFTLGSPTTSTSTFNLTNGTIKITGTPTLPSYTLISSSAGITGTPTLDAPIAGYTLAKIGNTLVLATPLALYDAWADLTYSPALTDKAKLDDQDADGLENLLEYAFGTQPTVTTGDLTYSGGTLTGLGKPVLETISGVRSIVFVRRKDYVQAGLTYKVEFSSSLAEFVDNNDTTNPPVVIATDGTYDAVRVTFPNFIEPVDGSGPQKPNFADVKVTSSF